MKIFKINFILLVSTFYIFLSHDLYAKNNIGQAATPNLLNNGNQNTNLVNQISQSQEINDTFIKNNKPIQKTEDIAKNDIDISKINNTLIDFNNISETSIEDISNDISMFYTNLAMKSKSFKPYEIGMLYGAYKNNQELNLLLKTNYIIKNQQEEIINNLESLNNHQLDIIDLLKELIVEEKNQTYYIKNKSNDIMVNKSV